MLILLAAAIGLLIGHLIDLVFRHFYTDERTGGRVYRCSECRASLRPVYALPILSFALTRGRCADCGKALPLRALLLPAGSAALFVVSCLVFEDGFGAALLGGLFSTVFLALTFTDLDRRLLPNRIVYPSILLAAALSWGWPETSVVEVFAGGATAALVAGTLLLLSLPFGAQAFGMGDVKMIVLMGFVLGVPSILVGIFIGTFTGGGAAAFLLATRLRSRRDYIPHGPFLAIGAVTALFWGQGIWDWYAG